VSGWRALARGPWAAALGAGLGAAFLAWAALTDAPGMRNPVVALPGYGRALAYAGTAAAVALLALAPRLGRGRADALALAALGAYAAAFKVVAGNAAPGVALALAAVLYWRCRGRARAVPAALLVVLHAQGTLAGLYLAARLGDLLAGWPGFTASMRAILP
jgi:hypothetical protein